MRIRRLRGVFSAVLFVLVSASGCAHSIPDANPEDIPQIRQGLAQDPGDQELQTRLGIALYKSGQNQEAKAVLEPLVNEGDAPNAAAYLYLGLANEGLEDWAGARVAYTSYLGQGTSTDLKDEIENRLQLIIRQEVQAQARQALAREQELSTQPPEPRTVAIFPFRMTTDNPDLEPLQVALADMMTTDLQLSRGVTVLERTQIQSLLNEMALSEAGLTESATGARAGRLLRSEHVIQGALTTVGTQLRVDADVLNTQQGQARGQATASDQLDAIFDMEKSVVFQVLEVLGVQLTPAERQAINDNRAENLLAFLAYGRGLEALDRGEYIEASNFFQQAVQLDPGFNSASEQQQGADQLQQAAATPPQEIANQATQELTVPGVASIPAPPPTATGDQGGGAAAGASTPGGSTTLSNVSGGVNPSPNAVIVQTTAPATGGGQAGNQQGQQRDAVQESTGTEGVTQTSAATIIIQIQRPAGD